MSSPQLSLFSDASNWGFAVIFRTHWAQGRWPREWLDRHINAREFFPIYLAMDLWGSAWSGHVITFFSDNVAVVQVINHAASKDPLMPRMLHAITLLALHYDCTVRSKYVPGFSN